MPTFEWGQHGEREIEWGMGWGGDTRNMHAHCVVPNCPGTVREERWSAGGEEEERGSSKGNLGGEGTGVAKARGAPGLKTLSAGGGMGEADVGESTGDLYVLGRWGWDSAGGKGGRRLASIR